MNRATSKQQIAGIILLGICVLAALLHYVLPLDPEYIDATLKFAPPSLSHPFGCDNLGRDILARVLAGAPVTILISLAVNLSAAAVGILIGLAAGYWGKWSDAALMQVSDAFMAIPGILLALMLITVGGSGIPILILALGIVFFPSYARICRSGVRQIRERDYIRQAELLNLRTPRILFAHILPCLAPQLIPAFVLGLGNAALAEASLSYLGMGIRPPAASWGKMMADGQSYLFQSPGMVLFPALFLILFVLGLFFLSEGLRNRIQKGGRA